MATQVIECVIEGGIEHLEAKISQILSETAESSDLVQPEKSQQQSEDVCSLNIQIQHPLDAVDNVMVCIGRITLFTTSR